MTLQRVRDVMSSDAITVRDTTPVAQIAAVLVERDITGVAVVDRFDAVIGVVSWSDLHDSIEIVDDARAGRQPARRWWRRSWRPRLHWPRRTALDVMSAPPVTIGPEASLAAAGRLMHRRDVGRLLVVDRHGRLVGLVSRSDLLKVYARLDSVIRDEVTQQLLRRTLMVPADAVRVAVDEGVVTLSGRTARRTTALAAVGLAGAVPGVTEVIDRLTFDADDTARPALPPAEPDPLRGWLVGRAPVPDRADALLRPTRLPEPISVEARR